MLHIGGLRRLEGLDGMPPNASHSVSSKREMSCMHGTSVIILIHAPLSFTRIKIYSGTSPFIRAPLRQNVQISEIFPFRGNFTTLSLTKIRDMHMDSVLV